MKKSWIWIALVIVAAIVVAIVATRKGKPSGEIRIGAVLPLTGDLASYGENAKNGILLLADEVNTNGGINGWKLAILIEDSKAQPNDAVAAIQKLINVNKVIAVIGDVASSPTLAMAPIANSAKIVLISPAASAPEITAAGPYVYRVWPSDVFEADRMAEYVKATGVKTVGILYVNNDYGRAMVAEFKKMTAGSSISVVVEDNFDQNATDVRAQLTKVRQANPEKLYLISYPKDSAIILRQYRELGLTANILSTSSFEDPLILREVGAIAEGVIFTSPVPPAEDDPVVGGFRRAYEQRFGKKPGLVADYGYDALLVVVEAIKRSAAATAEGVAKGIAQINDLNGATGLINFDENGDVVKPSGIKAVRDGKYVWLDK